MSEGYMILPILILISFFVCCILLYLDFRSMVKKDVSDTDECPLKKNKNTDSRKDGEGEKEDVKSGNED